MDKKKLGQALLKAKKLTKDKLKYALAMHNKIGGDFAPLLVKLGYVSDQDITDIIARLEGISTVDISSLVIPKKLVQSIPRDVIEKHNVMPITRKEGQIKLAMSNVNDYEAIEEIQFLTGCRVDPVLASRDAIRKSVIQFYYGDEDTPLGQESIDSDNKIKSLDKIIDEKTPEVVKALVNLLIEKNVVGKSELLRKIE